MFSLTLLRYRVTISQVTYEFLENNPRTWGTAEAAKSSNPKAGLDQVIKIKNENEKRVS